MLAQPFISCFNCLYLDWTAFSSICSRSYVTTLGSLGIPATIQSNFLLGISHAEKSSLLLCMIPWHLFLADSRQEAHSLALKAKERGLW